MNAIPALKWEHSTGPGCCFYPNPDSLDECIVALLEVKPMTHDELHVAIFNRDPKKLRHTALRMRLRRLSDLGFIHCGRGKKHWKVT